METIILLNILATPFLIWRVIAYVFFIEFNTKAKIAPEFWSDKNIREVAFEETNALRLIFLIRSIFTFLICFGGDVRTNELFLMGVVLVNFLFVLKILGFIGQGCDEGTVMKHIKPIAPKIFNWVKRWTRFLNHYQLN